MKISQVKMTAVIPTGQYANLQPEITVDLAAKDNVEDAKTMVLQHIEGISRMYAEEGKALHSNNSPTIATTSAEQRTMKCFVTGTEVFFDSAAHAYVDAEGNKYLSGSVFAHEYSHEFNKEMIAPKSAAKLEVSTAEVIEYWQSKGDISTTFGTALHQALEHYGKYKDLCEKDGKGTGLHPTLEPIVLAFFEKFGNETARYEPFVADPKGYRCGQIDRLVITGDKTCIIDDYKTNANLFKKGTPASLKAPFAYLPNVPMSKYVLQLNFYRAILEAAGWTVQGMRIHHWDGNDWNTLSVAEVDINIKNQVKIDLSKVVV